jgi:molybdate transport system substrate-binding protein
MGRAKRLQEKGDSVMIRGSSFIQGTAGIVILALLLTAGCTSSGPVPVQGNVELTVFAASSLSGALTEIAHVYEEKHPDTRIILNFDNSQALRTQIEQGAHADLFLSANTKHMTVLQGEGLILNDSVRIFAKNKLALLVPKSNPANITGISDLSRPGIRLVMGTKESPFGDYTRQVLGKMTNDSAFGPAYRDAVMANVLSEEPTATSLVAKIRIREADAGIAYASDIREDDREILTAIPIPDRFNVIATYPLGIVRESAAPERTAAFAEFISGPEGTAVLTRYGFTPSDR